VVREKPRGAAPYLPEKLTIRRLRTGVQTCHGCDLYLYTTQGVLGEGPGSARIVLVGKQPGDAEDRQGHPFVGPDGKLLDRALEDACKPWLEAEISLIRPRIIVCPGATAALSILGPEYRLTRERGPLVEHPWAPYVIATVHPSAVLRAPDDEQRHNEYARLVADLKKVEHALKLLQ
jgi:uracil-DNA glycosylase